MRDFYVYGHFYPVADPDEFGLPIYIGKGRGRRAWDHLTPAMLRNPRTPLYQELSRLIAAGVRPDVQIIFDELTEEQAYAWEEFLIRHWGRKDIETGILLNQTDGGNGGLSVGYRHTPEQKRKIAEATHARWADPSMRQIITDGMHRAQRKPSPRYVPRKATTTLRPGDGVYWVDAWNAWRVTLRGKHVGVYERYCDALKSRLLAESGRPPLPGRPRANNSVARQSVKIGQALWRLIRRVRREVETAASVVTRTAPAESKERGQTARPQNSSNPRI